MSETSALSGPAVLFQAVRSGNLIEVRRLIEDQGVAVSSEGPLDETDDVWSHTRIFCQCSRYYVRRSTLLRFIWRAGLRMKRSPLFCSIWELTLNPTTKYSTCRRDYSIMASSDYRGEVRPCSTLANSDYFQL